MKERKDAILKNNEDPMIRLMPYLMKKRNESVVYYRKTVPLTKIKEYLAQKRKEGQKISVFSFLLTAFLFLIRERPKLNHFVLGKRIYERKSIDMQYVVKQKMVDTAVETLAYLSLDENDTVFTVQDKIEKINAVLKDSKEDTEFFATLLKLPRFLLRLISKILFFMDQNNIFPSLLQKNLPFYSSIFVSNLASIGSGAAYHHLYELGTTSIFITIGKPYRAPYETEKGEVLFQDVLDMCFTIDERICDGFYLVRSFKYLDSILDNPEYLEKVFTRDRGIFTYLKQKRAKK